ncbi:MAG: hypothetical protein EAZ55_13345 [Cytophagales bacterium]|nr:MAG: hypothetical protein EAZ55_13345 [Cytophagales bacterium]
MGNFGNKYDMRNALTIINSFSVAYRIAELIIESLKIWIAIKPLQFLFKKRDKKIRAMLENCAENSVGKDIIKMLDQYDLKLIPFYEEHDLKHIVLDYGMTSEEEIRMQAYLFGNGNCSLPCVLFLLSGILLPSAWGKFYEDYCKGKNSPNISRLKLENCMNLPTTELKKKYKNCP